MKATGKKIVLCTAFIAAVAAVGLVASSWMFVRSDKICKGVSVSGINVGGMSKKQASIELKNLAKSRLNGRISIAAKDQKWFASASDLGVGVNWNKSLEKAMDAGRRGNLLMRISEMLSGPNKSKDIKLAVSSDAGTIRRTVAKIASVIDRSAKNASIIPAYGQMTVLPEESGIKIDRKSAIHAIHTALIDGKSEITLSPVVDVPHIKSDDLSKINTVLASYSTRFQRSKVDRTHNLQVATKHVNGTILLPGEEFSYNKTVGERSEDAGFRNAIIFVKGKMEEGLGGGVCQVSSTIYNAVLLSGLKITERHHHSRTVVYTPVGRDATVSYGSRDLRFRNNGSAPIYISSYISGSRLHVSIYGSSSDKKSVSIYNGTTKYTPVSGVKTVIDPTLPPGSRKVTDKGSKGVSTIVYRKILDESGRASVEVVSRDRYPVQSKIISVNPVKTQTASAGAKPAATTD